MGINNLDELKRENLCLHQTIEDLRKELELRRESEKLFTAKIVPDLKTKLADMKKANAKLIITIVGLEDSG